MGLSNSTGLSQTSTSGLSAGAYTRPADWPALPSPSANGINILTAVFPNGDNFAALSVTAVGGYTVDWGDGTIDTWASAAAAQHTYTYSTLATAVTSRSYKTAIVKITPTVPATAITAFDVGIKNTLFGTATVGTPPWLDITVNTPSATSIAFRSTLIPLLLEICTIIACGNLTTTALNSKWNGLGSLSVLNLPAGFGANVTSLNNTFQSTALTTLSLPAGFGGLANSLINTFTSAAQLSNIVLPAGFGSAATTISGFCNGCSSLRSITLPAGFGSVCTAVDNAFSGCGVLEQITLPSGFAPNATIMDYMFSSDWSLQSVVFPTGFGAGMLTMVGAFDSCYSLNNITFTTALGSLLTSTLNAFRLCSSLSWISGFSPVVTTSFANSTLSSTALNALYTGLPTITLQTLTVSANYGYAASTPTIATAKGWTVN